jgi:type IV secretory pathway protease TraF
MNACPRAGWITPVVLVVLLVLVTGPQWGPHVLAIATSPSIPPGLYLRDWSARPLAVGDMVLLQMPDVLLAFAPKDHPTHRLLKRVAALPGMTVCWEATQMRVQIGTRWAEYDLIPDAFPHRMMHGQCHVLTAEECVLVGTHPRSHDSRYIGPVALGLLLWRAWPVWTWEEV